MIESVYVLVCVSLYEFGHLIDNNYSNLLNLHNYPGIRINKPEIDKNDEERAITIKEKIILEYHSII